jgi:hypothetical protein
MPYSHAFHTDWSKAGCVAPEEAADAVERYTGLLPQGLQSQQDGSVRLSGDIMTFIHKDGVLIIFINIY